MTAAAEFNPLYSFSSPSPPHCELVGAGGGGGGWRKREKRVLGKLPGQLRRNPKAGGRIIEAGRAVEMGLDEKGKKRDFFFFLAVHHLSRCSQVTTRH